MSKRLELLFNTYFIQTILKYIENFRQMKIDKETNFNKISATQRKKNAPDWRVLYSYENRVWRGWVWKALLLGGLGHHCFRALNRRKLNGYAVFEVPYDPAFHNAKCNRCSDCRLHIQG